MNKIMPRLRFATLIVLWSLAKKFGLMYARRNRALGRNNSMPHTFFVFLLLILLLNIELVSML